LEQPSKAGEKMIIAYWTYTREEWKAFTRWKNMQKGLLYYVLYWLRPTKRKQAPAITIMPGKVWTNDNNEPFHEGDRRFRKIDIHDAGKINILEITYELGQIAKEIRIPIPKGKLREAIAIQEKITLHASPH
jgi:hypothetical protein